MKISRLTRFVFDRVKFLLYRKRVQSCRQIVYSILQKANVEIKYKEQLKSILHIQASSRAYFHRLRMRKKYVELKDKVHRYHYLGASLILQSHFRGYRVRKRFSTLISAVCKIQSFVRARWMRIYFLDLRKQVVKIQRIFRRYRLRRIKSKEMLLRMIHQIENVNAFQVVENALLYGVGQKTTLQYVFDINKGKRVDFVEVLQNKARDMTTQSDLDIRRGRLRSKSRDRNRI